MTTKSEQQSGPVLVFGATGQQGGAVARSLVRLGRRVRALVRDERHANARALAELGIELVVGDLRDRASVERACRGADGVFSIQPSSGQPEYGVTDADELAFGRTIVDVAQAEGVRHLVYTSMAGLQPDMGIGHFESKWAIEAHVRASGVPFTIVRPAAFMEILLQPHMGLAQRKLVFFLKPDDAMQFVAVEDIGALVGMVFAQRDTYLGRTVELAGEALTGRQLAAKISRATGAPVSYAQFPPEVLAASELLRKLVAIVDGGGVVGNADIPALKRAYPALLDFDGWLESGGARRIAASFAS